MADGAPGTGAGGEGLVRVATAANQAEAELIQGLLRSEGIPSVERRTRGFDVPDFLAAGPRDVLVPAPHEPRARELLTGGNGGRSAAAPQPPTLGKALRIAAIVAGGALLATLVAWLLLQSGA